MTDVAWPVGSIECAIGASSPLTCGAGHCRRCSDFRDGWHAALSPQGADTREAVIEELLAYEQARANLSGFSDCTCINHSRETERAYEYGQCPHQKARAALSRS
jgi:hypothetical protein